MAAKEQGRAAPWLDWKSFSSSPGSRGGSRSGGDPAPRPAARSHLTIVACSAPRASPSVPHDGLHPLVAYHSSQHTGGKWRRQPSSHPAPAGEPRGCCATRCNCTHQEHHVSAKQRGKMEEVFGKNCRNTMR